MEKITFPIPGVEEEYHIPLLNFDQQDEVLKIAPRFLAIISDKDFDFTKEENLVTAFLQLITTGAIFKKLAAAAICPASRDYYLGEDTEEGEIGDYKRNMKIVGRLPITYLLENHIDENGEKKLRPGVLLRSFFASNFEWFAPLGGLLNLWALEAKSEAEAPTDSEDTPPEIGKKPTG